MDETFSFKGLMKDNNYKCKMINATFIQSAKKIENDEICNTSQSDQHSQKIPKYRNDKKTNI